MLKEAAGIKRIIIRTGKTDLRYGIDRLASLLQVEYGLDPLEEGTMFLFCGNRKDRIKGLLYEDSGFLLLTKRLSKGTFAWPRNMSEARELSLGSFRELMDGYEVTSSLKIYDRKPIVPDAPLEKGTKPESWASDADPKTAEPANPDMPDAAGRPETTTAATTQEAPSEPDAPESQKSGEMLEETPDEGKRDEPIKPGRPDGSDKDDDQHRDNHNDYDGNDITDTAGTEVSDIFIIDEKTKSPGINAAKVPRLPKQKLKERRNKAKSGIGADKETRFV